MLELKNISFIRNNKKILDKINIKIEENELIVITGPNGSGKSTLSKIIMGIESPDEGEIIFNGENITKLTIDERAKKGISFAFQQPVKFKGITVYDLIKLSAGKEMKKMEACDTLSKVGLCAKEYIDREVNNSLSGGELKRVEIALAAVRESQLTVFDEPEAGIDLWSFNNLISVFEELRRQEGAILIISHQERILNIADKIILIKNGKIEQIAKNKDEIIGNRGQAVCCRLKKGE